jgi:hypothetical protein
MLALIGCWQLTVWVFRGLVWLFDQYAAILREERQGREER